MEELISKEGKRVEQTGREKQYPFLGPQGVSSERSEQRARMEGVTFQTARR